MSRSNSTEPTSFRKTHFTTDFSQSLNSTGAPSRSRVRDSPRRSSDLMARTNDSIQKSIIKSKESSRSRTLRAKSSKDVVLEQKTPDDSRLDLEIQGLQIDERLARLQTFLETTMQ